MLTCHATSGNCIRQNAQHLVIALDKMRSQIYRTNISGLCDFIRQKCLQDSGMPGNFVNVGKCYISRFDKIMKKKKDV